MRLHRLDDLLHQLRVQVVVADDLHAVLGMARAVARRQHRAEDRLAAFVLQADGVELRARQPEAFGQLSIAAELAQPFHVVVQRVPIECHWMRAERIVKYI